MAIWRAHRPLICGCVVAAACAIAAATPGFPPDATWAVLAAGGTIATLVIGKLVRALDTLYRCPGCGMLPYRNLTEYKCGGLGPARAHFLSPRACPGCGTRIR